MACDIRAICTRCGLEKPKFLMACYPSVGWLCHRCEWVLEQQVDVEERWEQTAAPSGPSR